MGEKIAEVHLVDEHDNIEGEAAEETAEAADSANPMLGGIQELVAENKLLKAEKAELKAAQPDLFASQTSAERKKYVKEHGWYLNQNTVTEDDMRAYKVRADRFAALDDEVIKAKKASLTTSLTTNMQLMGALAPFNVPNIGRMKKEKLLDALCFFELTQ